MLELLAQTTQPSPFPIDPSSFSSVAGIIVATTFLMQYVKTAIGQVSYLKKVPTFVYVVLVSLTLTVIANQVLHTLPGDLKTLLYSTASAALASSGFYQWLKDGSAGIETTHPDFKKKPVVEPVVVVVKPAPSPNVPFVVVDNEHIDLTPKDFYR